MMLKSGACFCRMKLRDVHADKEEKLRRAGWLPSSLIQNKALTLMLNNFPKDGFVPCSS